MVQMSNWRDAVAQAREILVSLPRGIPTELKTSILLRLADLLEQEREKLVSLATQYGFNFLQAGEIGAEVNKAAARLRHYAKHPLLSISVDESAGLQLVRRPAGLFAGYTAPNYPVIESAAISGFINSLLSSCPMVVRQGALTGQMDIALTELAAQAVRECAGPIGFISVCEVSREDTDAFLSEVDFLFFIGGPIGDELVKKTRKGYGVVQTGLPNAAVVFPGAEGVAATRIGEQFGSRLALSCSNTSGVLLHEDCDLDGFTTSLAECSLASCHARDRAGALPATRFVDGLRSSLQRYLEQGAQWFPAKDQGSYDSLRFGIDPILIAGPASLFTAEKRPPELFGRAVFIGQNDRQTDWQSALRRLPPTKTIQVFHPENACPPGDENILIALTSRFVASSDRKVNQPDPGPCSIHGSPLFGSSQVIDPTRFVIPMTIVLP